MRKIIFFTLILLFFTSSSAFAGITGKIKGTIVDSESKEPLPGVNIIIEGTTLGAAADGDGFFFIINVPPGTYSLKTSMVGYAAEIKEDVRVFVDRTITVDFELKSSAIAGEEVVVTAEREIVPLDVSSSQVSSTGEEIIEIPAVKDVEQYLNMQPGIENMLIRGGGQNQTSMMIDGVMMVDERVNKPTLSSINLSSIQDMFFLGSFL